MGWRCGFEVWVWEMNPVTVTNPLTKRERGRGRAGRGEGGPWTEPFVVVAELD